MPIPHLPWFRFRLRRLLIIVALLAIAGAYVGWQAAIVRHRKAMWLKLNGLGGFPMQFQRAPGDDRRGALPLVRQWLGDQTKDVLFIPDSVSEDETNEIQAAFPEAKIIRRDPFHARDAGTHK